MNITPLQADLLYEALVQLFADDIDKVYVRDLIAEIDKVNPGEYLTSCPQCKRYLKSVSYDAPLVCPHCGYAG